MNTIRALRTISRKTPFGHLTPNSIPINKRVAGFNYRNMMMQNNKIEQNNICKEDLDKVVKILNDINKNSTIINKSIQTASVSIILMLFNIEIVLCGMAIFRSH